jgi:IPT/TIG domain/Right handed beta helix region
MPRLSPRVDWAVPSRRFVRNHVGWALLRLGMALVLLSALVSFLHPSAAQAANSNSVEDVFARSDQTGWGTSCNFDGDANYAWGGAADGSNANVTISGGRGIVANGNSTSSTSETLSTGSSAAGGDALVKVSFSATDSGEAGPILNYSSANGGSYYEADLESELNRLQFSVLKNGVFSYPGGVFAFTVSPNTAYWVRLDVSGSTTKTIQARAWQYGATEPSTWQLSVTDSTPIGTGVAGTHTAWASAKPGETISFSAFAATTSGLAVAPTPPNTIEDTFTRANQTGWGASVNEDGVTNRAWSGDAGGTNSTVTLANHLGVVTNNNSTASASMPLSDGNTYAGGDTLVKVMASATDSGEIGPILNYSSANGGSYYEADFETENSRLQFSFAKNGAFTYPGGVYALTIAPNTFYWIRLHVSGTTTKSVQARAWQDGASEPTTWQLSVTDSTPIGNGLAGVHTAWQYARLGETLSVAAFGSSASGTAIIPTMPTVSSFMPATGQYGDAVTLTGTGFTGATGVRFNGVDALAYSVTSDTTITARVPNAGAQTGLVSVSTSASTGWSRSTFAITTAAGSVYWVATAGNDANSGDYTHPFATIAHADSVATAGAHVHVLAGSYSLSSTLYTSASGTASAPIVYISDTLYGAQLDMSGSGTDLQHRSTWEVNGSYEQVLGFDLTTSGSGARAGVIVYGNQVTIARNHVHDIYRGTCHDYTLGGAGIDVIGPTGYSSTPYAVVDSNLIENVGANLKGSQCQDQVHGIYISTSYNTVTNNIVRSAVGYGIQLFHNPNHNTIANNDVDHSGDSGLLVGAQTGYAAQYNVVANNISRDNGGNGVHNDHYGIRTYNEGTGILGNNSYLNNDNFHNDDGQNNPAGETYIFGTNNTISGQISSDPLYVNYTGQDYHLQSSSPAKDTGTATGAPTHDFDQVTRPQGAATDIGAYEFH